MSRCGVSSRKRSITARIEDRLGHDEVGAGRDLPFEPPEFAVVVERAGFGARGHVKVRGLVEGLAGGIDAVVEPVDPAQKLDRVEIVDGRRVGIVADLGRVAGDHHQIADPEGMRAEQVALQREQVAVAAADVQQNLGAGLSPSRRRGRGCPCARRPAGRRRC